MKRVAAAVGEGAMSVPLVHRYIADCETPGSAAEHVADFAWLRARV